MAYKECSQCEFIYPDESGKAACACMSHEDLPSFCPLRTESDKPLEVNPFYLRNPDGSLTQ